MSNIADDQIVKDPHVAKKYTVPWATALGTATISTTAWSATPAGLTVQTPGSNTTNTTTTQISGGALGQVYEVVNTITTNDGQTLDYHIEVRIALMLVDYSTNVGKVRAIIGDTDPTMFFMKDAEIEALLVVNSDNVLQAAVMTLRAMATKHINILKDAVTLDIETRASNMARELNKMADSLEKRIEDLGEDQAFTFIEMINDDFSLREKLSKEMLIW